MNGKEFKKYENHVQRFAARLSKTVSKLHDEGHIDEIALQKINKLVKDLWAILPPLKVLQLSNNTTSARMPMSEPGKVEERLGIDMDLYHMPCKAGNGLGSDILPRECTPAEIKSSVAEAGMLRGDICN
jgi:hypothetical protein